MTEAGTRRRIIAGNWKMQLGPIEAGTWVRNFAKLYQPNDRTIIVIPPAVSIAAVAEAINRTSSVCVGVQNIHWEEQGAFTGETSARMAASAGASYALCGHSERRKLFGETDEQVGKKAAAAYRHRLQPIICVGETAAERKAGEVENVLKRQITAALATIRVESPLIIAYEPVWAIGTGQNATPEDAAAAHQFLRKEIAALRDEKVADETPILYGGSVKPENAGVLMSAPDVDGLLVGGASLEPDSFARICMVTIPVYAPPEPK